MLYDSRRQLARPRQHSTCPACGQEVIAKCGEIVIWHWAHVHADCDPWAEPESQWHLGWKQRLEGAGCQIEVVMGNHRADVVTPFGHIIELQNDYQTPDRIRAREDFYGEPLQWVYRCHWKERLQWQDLRWFWWKNGSPSMLNHKRRVLWDIDGELAVAYLEREEGWRDDWGVWRQRIIGTLNDFASHEAWVDAWTRRSEAPIGEMVENLMLAFTAPDGEVPQLEEA